MLPRGFTSSSLGSARTISKSIRALTRNFKTYFPRKPTGHPHFSNFDWQPDQFVRFPLHEVPHSRAWRDEPRWVRQATYTAGLMSLGLCWTYYYYREPVYATERLQLCFLPEVDVDDYLQDQIIKVLYDLGINGVQAFFALPFTMPNSHPQHVLLKNIFDNLVDAGGLEVLDLEFYMMDSPLGLKSRVYSHPYSVVIFRGELGTDDTICGLAAMIASRIARKVLNHDVERANHNVFSCLTGVPATSLVAASLRSRRLRRFAIPCLALYTVGLISHWIYLKYQQEKEEDLVSLILMSRAGYDPTEAVYYRDNLVSQGEILLKHPTRVSLKAFTEEEPMGLLDMKWKIQEKLGIDWISGWTRQQRRHLRNVRYLLAQHNIAKVSGVREEYTETEYQDGDKGDEESKGEGK